MFPPNTWVFDLEIMNAIPDKKTPPLPGVRYCKHWGDHSNMGISVISLSRPDGSEIQDFTGDPHMPMNAAIGTLMDFNTIIQKADLVITYGGRVFDSKVLAARGIYIRPAYHLDFLYEVKKAINNQAPKGWKLSDAAQRVGFAPKDFDGALAPIYWQQGRYSEVIEYCHTDVYRTCALAQFYAGNGASLIGPDSTRVALRTIPQIITSQ
jgi:hypothetical protein